MEIRQRLATPAPHRRSPGDDRQAAVLVPLYVNAGELWTVLTRRSEDLPHHKSQIAFPGGTKESGEDSWAAALRETQEELGIDPKRVMRLGQLDEAATPSGFHIVPCVGAVPYPLEMEINQGEIAEVFSVPLQAFADVRVVEEQVVRINEQDTRLRVYHVGSRRVWGLTARIVESLMQRLGLDSMPGIMESEA